MDEKTKELLLTLIENLSEPEYITQRECGEPCIKGKNLRFLKKMIERMQFMKIWVDDVRPAPIGYIWCKSVNEAIERIEGSEIRVGMLDYNNSLCEEDIRELSIDVIDLDHDAGDYAYDGGDYIKILDYLEETERDYPIRIHSMNPVGVENMRRIIRRNGWTEVK